MTRFISSLTVALATTTVMSITACAPHADDDWSPPIVTPEPEPEPEPEPHPEPNPFPGNELFATASISSVHVMHDCAPPPAQPAQPVGRSSSASEPAPTAGAPMHDADARFACMGSTMQMAFTPHEGPGEVVLTRVVLKSADSNKRLSKLHVHRPMHWTDDAGYTDWNMTLPQRQDAQASFTISNFNWSKVESTLGGTSSWGQMFVIEAEVEIDGRRQTLRSPQFSRSNPDMVVT